ncbi:Gfo/Idh/MocA family oxidoreductase [Microbispora sp. NBRC 16548]|uniref:Gfo/Idh/MocA family protein n=1 Tax=Microbispora sp. NBRC 16548 TaxID=3030994 RepID=UPI001613F5E2|nr:Gfo/Idh/MocA family oxidoreductase [Microbispora sp. NBRC 16548]GLX11033.1 oxidoreductase [Microbispora sp. NBRC 16548]
MTNRRPVRVAIVGTGGIAEGAHVPALAAQGDRVQIVAACDVDPERVKSFCDAHDIPGAYTDLGALLEDAQPDLVHLCTPPGLHAQQARRCLLAGAWVWMEKPPCLSLAEYDLITEAEQSSGAYASVVFQHRFGAAGRHAAVLIASGELGRPLVAHCATTWYRPHAYFDVPWRGSWESEGGGPTMGHGIHQMDLMLALLGDWSEVTAMAARLDRDVQTEDVSVAAVRFDSGALATVVNSVLSPREESYIRIDLTEATVEVRHLYGYGNGDWTYTPAPHVNNPARLTGWTAPRGDEPSSHAAQLTALLDAYDRGERPQVSGQDARRTLELVTAIYRSAFTRTTVTRTDLTADDPFYHRLHGDTGGWAAPAPSESE